MNKIKKINVVLIMIVLIICMFANKAYAELNCNVVLSTSNNKVTYNETFNVYISISNLQTTKGIVAIGANLSYDTDSLSLVDIKGENSWSDPFYNSLNGKITSFKNKLSTSNENVFKITFEVNEKGKARNSAWVKISNFEISDGDEEKNCGGNSINIAIGELDNGNSEENNNQGGNSQGGNNQSGNTGNNNQNSGNKPINKPNSGTTKPTTNKPTNGQAENLNNIETSNENNVTTNIIENAIGENSTKNENVINNNTNNILENNIHNEEIKDNKKSGKLIFYIATIIVIVGILFLMGKHQKMNRKSKK